MIDLHGQPYAQKVLSNLVQGRVTSPLLLWGPSGVGRKFSALLAIQTLFSQRGDAEGHAVQIRAGTHADLTILSPEEGKSIGVQAVREAVALSFVQPSTAAYRAVLIDGADRLTVEASNALLKALEEPAPHTRFILLSESLQGVLGTIVSRCLPVRYFPLDDPYILCKLEVLETHRVKALTLTRMAEGSLGDAVRFCTSGKLRLRDTVFSLLERVGARDVPPLLSGVDEVADEFPLVVRFLRQFLRDLYIGDPSQRIHLDLEEPMSRLQNTLTIAQRDKLRTGLKMPGSNLDKVFRLKTVLVEAALA